MTPMSEGNAYVLSAPEAPFPALYLFNDTIVVIRRSTATFERLDGNAKLRCRVTTGAPPY
jgi:hypothetical protein